ncbi:MAG: amidohydrolase family protein, partial [bacterium]
MDRRRGPVAGTTRAADEPVERATLVRRGEAAARPSTPASRPHRPPPTRARSRAARYDAHLPTPREGAPALTSTAAATGIVDIHAHYSPPAWTRLVREQGLRDGARYAEGPQGPLVHVEGEIPSGPITPEFVDLDLRLAAMDLQGVQWQALSLTQPMACFDDADFSEAIARTFNDSANDAHAAHPDRFVGLATLPLNHPQRAVAELTRAAALPGIRGVYFGTNTGRYELSDRALFPVYEAICALGLPLFLHPVRQAGFDRLAPVFLRNLIGTPMETAVAASD